MVCLVGNIDPPLGGVSTYCRNLSVGLLELGAGVAILDTEAAAGKGAPPGLAAFAELGRAATLAAAARGGRVPLDLFPMALRAAYRQLPARSRLRVRAIAAATGRLIDRTGGTVVQTSHAAIRSLGAILAARRAGIPSVVTVFGSEFTSPALRSVLPVARAVCHNADAVVAISHHTASEASRQGVQREITVIHPGIDTDAFQSHTRKPTTLIRAGATVVLFTGWLIERKGPQVLLRALERLPARTLDRLEVLFVGPDHGMERQLRAHVAARGWHNVRVLGEVPWEELRSLYRVADALVFPTITADEGFGLVAVEAAASGCAILASRIGAIPEVVADGVNGYLLAPDNAGELAERIQQLVADPTRLRLLQEQSPNVAARFHYLVTARRMLDLYRHLAPPQ